MKFFFLNCPEGDEKASRQEIVSQMKASRVVSVEQLIHSHNHSSEPSVPSYLICKVVFEHGIKRSKARTVLQVVMRDLNSEKKLYNFKCRFFNDMALDMADALKNIKINFGNVIVLRKPVVHLNTTVKNSAIEFGLIDDQAIEVWQHTSGYALYKTPLLEDVSHWVNKMNIMSIEDSLKTSREHLCGGTVLSYFIKPVVLLDIDGGQVDKAVGFFREIRPNGKIGFFFKMTFHKNLALDFQKVVEDKSFVHGDLIAFVNPEIFYNPVFKYSVVSSEPFTLEIGGKEGEKIVFCEKVKNLQMLTKKLSEKKTITCSTQNTAHIQTVLPCEQTQKVSCDFFPTVSVENTSKLCNDKTTCVIPLALIKPSKDTITLQNLSLVSGYCNQFCQILFMYSGILWSMEEEPLCPKCSAVLKLYLSLEFHGLLAPSGELVKVLITGRKAEKFLQVSCQDFLNNNESRKLALKVLESKYVYGSEYKAFRLGVSDVSQLKLVSANQLTS